MNFFLCLIVVGGIAALIVLRLWLVLCFRKKGQHSVSVRVLVVAGSGGHTTEILRLLGSLSKGYNPRHYVLADTDKMSAVKIRLFEEKRAELDSESLRGDSIQIRSNEELLLNHGKFDDLVTLDP